MTTPARVTTEEDFSEEEEVDDERPSPLPSPSPSRTLSSTVKFTVAQSFDQSDEEPPKFTSRPSSRRLSSASAPVSASTVTGGKKGIFMMIQGKYGQQRLEKPSEADLIKHAGRFFNRCFTIATQYDLATTMSSLVAREYSVEDEADLDLAPAFAVALLRDAPHMVEELLKKDSLLYTRRPSASLCNYYPIKLNLSALHIVAQTDAINVAKKLLQCGASIGASGVNDKDEHGPWTPLHEAIIHGHTSMVELFLLSGADANIGDVKPVVLATSFGHSRILKLLLDHGGNRNIRDISGYHHYSNRKFPSIDGETDIGTGVYAIHIAASVGHLECLNLLLSSDDCEVDPSSYRGETPLILSLKHMQGVGVVSSLLKHGADPNRTSFLGDIPLLLAALLGDSDVVSTLLSYNANINQMNIHGQGALVAAATMGHSDATYMLLDYGAEPSVSVADLAAAGGFMTLANELKRRYDQWTPNAPSVMTIVSKLKSSTEMYIQPMSLYTTLCECFQRGQFAVAEAVAQRALPLIDPAATTSLLSLCVQHGSGEVATIALTNGHRPYAKDIRLCAEQGYSDVLNAMLSILYAHGSDVTDLIDCDEHGSTALNIAAAKGYVHVIEILIKLFDMVDQQRHQLSINNAPPNDRCVDRVNKYNICAIMATVTGLGVPSTTHQPLPSSTILNIVTQFLNINVDVEIRNNRKLTILEEVCVRGIGDVADVLIKYGAKVNRVDRGVGPLYWAVINNHDELVSLLFQHGAQVGGGALSTTLASASLLHLACMKGNIRIATLLLDHGADIDQLEPCKRETALHYAARQGHIEVMRLLERRGADLTLLNRDGITAATMLGLSAFSGEKDRKERR